MKTHWYMTGVACIAALLAPAALAAADVAGPSLGYLYDSNSRTLTAVQGIAGASVRGATVSLPAELSVLQMASGRDYGIGVLENGAVALVEVSGAEPAIRPLKQAMAAPDEIVFSPSGSSALLYSRASGRLQVLVNPANDTGQPRETVAADATALAVSDDGLWAVFANADGLWSVDAAGTLRRAAGMAGVQAAAFRPGSNVLVFATSTALYSIPITAGDAEAALIKDGMDKILAVAGSADGAWAFASSATGVTAVRAADSAMKTLGCYCDVTSFEPMKGSNVFRLSKAGSGPTYLFDGGGAEPRIVFIPGQAPAEDNSTGGGSQ